MPIECAQGDRQRDARTISLLWTSLLLFHGGDVTCFDVMKLPCGVRWSNVVCCELTCGELPCFSCNVACDVMSCLLMWWSRQLMRYDCLRCVMSRDAKGCHGDELSCYLMGPAMGWNVMSSRCHWLWGPVVWFEVVLWPCGDPNYYSVLQSTTPELLCTTKYYSSTTKYYSNTALYYKLLLCTTKSCSSTGIYSLRI